MYLFIDTETGGLDPARHSLLTICADIVPEFGREPVGSFTTAFKHDPYRISPRALEVNNIDLVEHDKYAGSAEEAAIHFHEWIKLASVKPQPVGWNIGFDLGFIYQQFIPKAEWDTLVDYHSLDVCALVEFLIIAKKLPPKRRLVDVARHLGLATEGAHDAAYDNYLCMEVVARLLKLA